MGATLQQDSRARSNVSRLPALFLTFSVCIHGLYYPQEWLIYGFILASYIMTSYLSGRYSLLTENYSTFGLTDSLLAGLIILSLFGMLHPVKLTEGLFEALHWIIFWFSYRLGVRISLDETAKKNLLHYIEWLAIGIAVIGWLPWVNKVGGRLSSVFGYPNAAAAFLGAVLLLNPRKKIVSFLLAISLLGTGSRAGVGLFFIILFGRQLMLRVSSLPPILTVRRNLPASEKTGKKYLRGLFWLAAGSFGTLLTQSYYKPAWENLTAWGFSSSSWQERLIYFKDGLKLAWSLGGLPQAGGWLAFPTVQPFPYWTADPHSSFIHILLNQGVLGIISVVIWSGFMLVLAWKGLRKSLMQTKSGVELAESEVRLRAWSALLFLLLHSLVDADFSFGSLGILFWLLFGSLLRPQNHLRRGFAKQKKFFRLLSKKMGLALSLITLVICGGALLHPILITREQVWNAQASQWRDRDPDKSRELWSRSLKLDQTQIKVRRELAENLLKQGKLDTGLEEVKEVLRWQAFDLEAYEWAQSVVWEAAEEYRQAYPEMAEVLYCWVEDVPKTIDQKLANLNSLDRRLWQGHKDFKSSPHIILLAEYSRQRQLTQLLP